jgi:uncharacterized coiled-coil protein SlyX
MLAVGTIVIWALLTGGITGGVWVSIVLLANHAKLRKEQAELGTGIAERRAEVARLEARLAFLESQFARVDEQIAAGAPPGPPNTHGRERS